MVKMLVKKEPAATGSLQERAMIVRLNVSRWYGYSTDSRLAQEIAAAHKAEAAAIRTGLNLMADEALAKINSITNRARADHKFRTLPWDDNAGRILSSVAYFDYMDAMRKFIAEFDEAKLEFADAYPEMRKKGMARLGDIAKDHVYPDPSRILDHFSMAVRVLPIPAKDDFRVKLGSADLKSIYSGIEDEINEKLAEAMRDPWQRLFEKVNKMVESLSQYEVGKDGKRIHSFKDSLVSNLTDVLDVIPGLNIMGDTKLDAAVKAIRERLIKDPEVLRDDEKVRKATIAEAEKIRKRLEDFI